MKNYPQPDEEENIDDITLLEPTATYSYADYLTWTFKENVELIKGKFFPMSPAPLRVHQKISINLINPIYSFLQGKPCEVYHAPFDVRLPQNLGDSEEDIYSVVQPDLCIICNLNLLDEKGCNGAPDLIIEILSPGTREKDLHDKFALYEENKVQEYWVVSPEKQTVDVFLLEANNRYGTAIQYKKEDAISAKTLVGLEISLPLIFT